MTRRLAALAVIAIMLSGCSFNINLMPPEEPLSEKLIEGQGEAKILIVDVAGFISSEAKSTGLSGRKQPSMPDRIRQELLMAANDPAIKGVVLRINTPGGSAAASDLIYHEIMNYKARTKVPVYASIMDMGTSGGLFVAAAADRIVAQHTSVTGSIGVITVSLGLEGLMDKLGIEGRTYKSGPNKDVLSPFAPETPEQRAIIQSIVDGLFTRFVDVVAQSRKGLSRERVLELADGRPYTAPQALENGLIDHIGYLDQTIEMMKKNLGLAEARVIEYSAGGEASGASIYSLENSGTVNFVNLESPLPREGMMFMYLWDGR